jgi:hypothetical protein
MPEFENLFNDDNALWVVGSAALNLNVDQNWRSKLAAKIEAMADLGHVGPDQAAFYRMLASHVRDATYDDLWRLVTAGRKCLPVVDSLLTDRMRAQVENRP